MQIVRGDIRDPFQIRHAIIGGKIDRVYHLAALISVPYSFCAPSQFIETNVLGTLNVAMACIECDAEMVHTSSSEVYGNSPVPQGLDTKLDPRSPYAASKVGADALIKSLILSKGLKAGVLRPFNTFGPGQSARAVITRIITQLVEGNMVQLGNIYTERDFTYVSDTVSAFTMVPCDGNIYVCGTGKSHSIAWVAGKIATFMRKTDYTISMCEETYRSVNTEVMHLMSDAISMNRLGWHPKVPFEVGLDKTIMWVLDNYNTLSEYVE